MYFILCEDISVYNNDVATLFKLSLKSAIITESKLIKPKVSFFFNSSIFFFLLKVFESKVPENIINKCLLISKLDKKKQEKIFGQKDKKLKDVLDRKYTLPFLFTGEKKEKNRLLKILNANSLTLQEGGRVSNLCDNVDKVKSMNKVIRILKKTEDKIKTIAVGDNYNDLDMLKNCDIPCLVFNDQFIQDQINIDNLIFSNKPSPEGWADVIKTALLKLNY